MKGLEYISYLTKTLPKYLQLSSSLFFHGYRDYKKYIYFLIVSTSLGLFIYVCVIFTINTNLNKSEWNYLILVFFYCTILYIESFLDNN